MPIGPFLEESDDTARLQLAVNVDGVLHGMKVVLPRMLARGYGHVVNVASGAGKTGYPGGATHCATKHAVVGLTEAVHMELRGTGVGLSLVMPAIVNTELTSGMRRARFPRSVEPEDVAAAIVAAVRTGRFDVYAPRELGAITRVMFGLPPERARATGARGGGDRALLDFDASQRLAYKQRVTQGTGED